MYNIAQVHVLIITFFYNSVNVLLTAQTLRAEQLCMMQVYGFFAF